MFTQYGFSETQCTVGCDTVSVVVLGLGLGLEG